MKVQELTEVHKRWGKGPMVFQALLCVGLAVVHGTEANNDFGLLLAGLGLGHLVTHCIWVARVLRIQREHPSLNTCQRLADVAPNTRNAATVPYAQRGRGE